MSYSPHPHPYAHPLLRDLPAATRAAPSPSLSRFDTAAEPMRRQGSGTVTRRVIVDEHGVEREETRDERRARKERERAKRAAAGADVADGASPERRRRSSRTSRLSDGVDFNAASLGSPPIPSGSPASVASPSLPSSSAPGPTSSKSVLTVALQRAQSAVLLDSANNFPAAVTAYTQSVRLLREVMARVEEGSRDMERKLSTSGLRDGETLDEWERLRARYERKERAKIDEARRLRVIHDTYEDRIRMLVQMGHPAPGFTPSSSSLPPVPSFPSSLSLSAAAPTNQDLALPLSYASPTASAGPSASPSLASLRLDDPPMLDPPLAAPYRPREAHARDRSVASLHILAPPADDAALDGIGAAMLLPSPTQRGIPALASLPVAVAPDNIHLTPSRGPSRPLSYASDSTATATARTPNTATPTPMPHRPIPFEPPLESPSASSSASVGDQQPLHTALETGPGWPASSSTVEPVEPPVRRPTLASIDMRRGSSTSALSGDTLRIGLPNSVGMARGLSTATFTAPTMRRGSSLGTLGAAEQSPVEIRPRPVRTASLAGIVPPAPLVNASTSEGTISLRRSARSPVPFEDTGQGAASGIRRPAPAPALEVRAPSSEADRPPYAFPPPASAPGPPAKAAERGFSASSLPGRLRALSQPGTKRPKLPSFDADAGGPPPVPPLLTGQRSTSASHTPSASLSSASASVAGGSARKNSIPTPTSLSALQYAQLDRSNSSSSIGSTASRLSPSPLDPAPLSAATSPRSVAGSPSVAQLPSAGVYLSAGLPSPPQAGSASSREATLALPIVRRPFHLMRLVAATIPAPGAGGAGGGGYLSERLFVPAQAWTTSAGAKLVALETKVRMLDLVATGLDALDRAGRALLLPGTGLGAARAREEAARFARELESFDGLAEGIHSTLAKKLGQGVVRAPGAGAAGALDRDGKQARKPSSASFSSWSSKLTMSLNRVVANGASLDSQATYVDAIAKVFRQAQLLDLHLSLLFPSPIDDPVDSAYATLSTADRHRAERHLRRASEFFGLVVCRFVLCDVGILLDKYVKRGGAWLSGE